MTGFMVGLMVSITAKYPVMNKVTDKSSYIVGWPMGGYTSSCGQVTFLTTIESAVLTLPDFNGCRFLGGSLMSPSESDSSSEVLMMVRIGARHILMATISWPSLDNSAAATLGVGGGGDVKGWYRWWIPDEVIYEDTLQHCELRFQRQPFTLTGCRPQLLAACLKYLTGASLSWGHASFLPDDQLH